MPNISSNHSSHSRTHTRSFSLEAFQNLISRRASILTHFSPPRTKKSRPKCDHPALNHALFFPKLQTHAYGETPFPGNLFPNDPRPRSIITESECSEDEIRDNEGWIPIHWDESTPVSPSPVLTPFPRQVPSYNHSRNGSLRSESSISSFQSESIFSAQDEEGSPPMTPVSASFGHRTRMSHMENRGDKYLSVSTEYYVEEKVNWLFESTHLDEAY
jgi:hypothetical protein